MLDYYIFISLVDEIALLPQVMVVKNTTVFPLSKILSHFVRKPRFNLHQNCVTNSIYMDTMIQIEQSHLRKIQTCIAKML